MKNININVPINSTSFGNLSLLLIRQIFESELKGNTDINFNILPIGPVDFSSQSNIQPEFQNWLNNKIVQSLSNYKKTYPTFKLWHLNGSEQTCGNNTTLLSFYELDSPTKVELNIASQNRTVFTSKYTCNIFENFGVKTEYIPLAFDNYNFSKLDKVYHNDGRIVFNISSKFEKRKSHVKMIQSWIKKFGNNHKFALQCSIYNNFLNPQQNEQIIAQLTNGNKPFNVNFYKWFKTNVEYNDYLNSADVTLDLSGGEGWSLPSFHSVAIGKHAVVMNAHGIKEWANEQNSVLVNPNGKEPAYDGMFFHQGQIYNQGNIFTFDEEEFLNGCDLVIERVNRNRINIEGIKLQSQFQKEKFLENVINLTI